jgi:ATP-dependent Clp protease ATP-binding subunit ClpC
MRIANQQAMRFRQDYIGPEHVLLGLCEVESEDASKLLATIGIDVQKLRAAVEELAWIRSEKAAVEALASISAPKGLRKVIENAMDETRELGHDDVGVGHILLGLLRFDDQEVNQIVTREGVTLDTARTAIHDLLERG